jgi:hypothetical protein
LVERQLTVLLSADVLQDELAVSLACAVATANKRAAELGVDVRQCLVTITQMIEDEPRWCINYGPKDYLGWRGGGLIVEVDPSDATVKHVLYGQ